jgi:hypothetical protein
MEGLHEGATGIHRSRLILKEIPEMLFVSRKLLEAGSADRLVNPCRLFGNGADDASAVPPPQLSWPGQRVELLFRRLVRKKIL